MKRRGGNGVPVRIIGRLGFAVVPHAPFLHAPEPAGLLLYVRRQLAGLLEKVLGGLEAEREPHSLRQLTANVLEVPGLA